MKKTTIKTYIAIALVTLAVLFGMFVPRIEKDKRATEPSAQVATAEFTLKAGDTTLSLNFSPGENLAAVLLDAKQKGTIVLSGKEYPGLGFFVTDIGPLHSGEGKYLIYYINGVEATVGVSSYVFHAGDSIVWKLQ